MTWNLSFLLQVILEEKVGPQLHDRRVSAHLDCKTIILWQQVHLWVTKKHKVKLLDWPAFLILIEMPWKPSKCWGWFHTILPRRKSRRRRVPRQMLDGICCRQEWHNRLLKWGENYFLNSRTRLTWRSFFFPPSVHLNLSSKILLDFTQLAFV